MCRYVSVFVTCTQKGVIVLCGWEIPKSMPSFLIRIWRINMSELNHGVLMWIFSCEWIRGTCLSNMVVSVEVKIARLSVVIYEESVRSFSKEL